MISPAKIRQQVENITVELIECNLSVAQNFPSYRTINEEIRIDFGKADLSIALKNISYIDIYNELSESRSYNIRLIDGALIQLMYKFQEDSLHSHRLAFFPSPYLEEYQNNPEIYENDEIYADIIKKNIVPFPIRFDFNSDEELFVDVEHPKSHLTLGQYQNCRIPVSAPLTPYVFVTFLLQNFYNTAFIKVSKKISIYQDAFTESISDLEKEIPHLRLAT